VNDVLIRHSAILILPTARLIGPRECRNVFGSLGRPGGQAAWRRCD
jgi:hypothetical protein